MTMEPTKINAPWRELEALEEVRTDSDVLETLWAGEWKPLNRIKLEEVSERQRYLFRSKSPFSYSIWEKEGWTIRCVAIKAYPMMSKEQLAPLQAATLEVFDSVLSPESKDPMDQFHEYAMQNNTAAPVEVPPGTVLESGYRLLKRGDVVQLSDEIMHKGKWRPVPPREVGWKIDKVRGVRRRKIPEWAQIHPTPEVGFAMPSTPAEDLLDDVPTYNSTMTHVTIPVAHAWHPKPFTPNKYTRYIPTLDGRKAPVDVYCVLAAFPTGSSAVDHAVKKLLAPGARGVKSRLQDLKEARDSMSRAIELEEADAP